MNKLLKIIFTLVVLFSMALACTLSLWKYDSAEGDALRNLAYVASEYGFTDIARQCLKKARLDAHKSDINSSIAFALHKEGKEKEAQKLARSKLFNLDSYESRALAYDIMREPLWMKNLLEYKYLEKIKALKGSLAKILPLYALRIKLGDEGKSKTDEILEILRKFREDKYVSDAVYPIAKLASNNGYPEDFVKFMNFLNTEHKNNILMFEFLEDIDNRKVWAANKEKLQKHDKLRIMHRLVKQAVAKNDEELIRKAVFLYPMRYDFNWRKTRLDDFNIPTKVYFTKIYGANKLHKKYLRQSLSPQTLRLTLASREKYLVYLASVLAEIGEINCALSLLQYSPRSGERLKILNAIISSMKPDKSNLERAKDELFRELN